MDRYEEAARVVLSQMTLEEKVFLMSGHTSRTSMHGALKGTTGAHYNENPYLAGGCARLKVPPIAFCDGSKGVVCGTGKSTAFPVSLMRGATFHPQLERKIGHAIGREIRAYGGTLFGGVCLNLLYVSGHIETEQLIVLFYLFIRCFNRYSSVFFAAAHKRLESADYLRRRQA